MKRKTAGRRKESESVEEGMTESEIRGGLRKERTIERTRKNKEGEKRRTGERKK
jgi:hypothetical protein